MTERLAQLMTLEVERLDVPPPPAADVLARGRGVRRRRRVTTGVAAAAVIAVVGAGIALAVSGGPDERAVDPAKPVADVGATFAIGTTLYLDGGAVIATIDDRAVKSLYYTSAGVVVRHGNNTDNAGGGGPQRFSLVTPDGAVRPLGLETEDVVHATDLDQPYLAYVDDSGATTTVFVHDVVTDEQVAAVPLPQATGAYYPVSLSGDLVFVGDGAVTYLVDFRTGEVTTSDVLQGASRVAGDVAIAGYRDGPGLVDALTGDVLLSADLGPDGNGYLNPSPDGRFAQLRTEDVSKGSGPAPETTVEVYDVGTGASVTLPDAFYGWSAEGDLVAVDDAGRLTTCSPTTGKCTTDVLDLAVRPNELSQPLSEPVCVPVRGGGSECSTEPPANYSDDLVLGGLVMEA